MPTPVLADPPHEQTETWSLADSNPQTATVYIAEDNPILLQGLARALTANGYSVTTAEDGAVMLGLLAGAETPPDLLLLDVMMPGMTGLEVLQQLRADPRWSALPVMLITAASDESLPTSARQNGAVDVLIKPFRLGELLARIQSHIRRGGGGGGGEEFPPLDARPAGQLPS